MLQIKQRDTTPPRGWDYQVEGGPLIEGGDFGELVLRVLDYNVKHGLPTDNLAAIVEDEICRRKGIKCAPPRPAPDGSTRTIGVADVWRFLFTMKTWMKNGTIVDQDEAERRAEICAGCRFQVTPTGCFGCSGILGTLFAIIGDRKTRMDHALQSCGICGCENRVSCWAPMHVLTQASPNLEYPADTDGNGTPCWKRISPN